MKKSCLCAQDCFVLFLHVQNSNEIAFMKEILKCIMTMSIIHRNCRGSIKHHKSQSPFLLFGACALSCLCLVSEWFYGVF